MENKMNKSIFITFALLLIGCSGEDSVLFEKISYQIALEKAQRLNKSIMVNVFSDG
jgi:hypothetical protein